MPGGRIEPTLCPAALDHHRRVDWQCRVRGRSDPPTRHAAASGRDPAAQLPRRRYPSRALEINDSMLPDIAGRDVLLVDDIFDTGRTLERLVEEMRSLGARSVRSAVLLRKQGRQEVPLVPDHVAFEIPDAFVVGYGLDYRDAFRHLPYLAVLDADDLAAGADA